MFGVLDPAALSDAGFLRSLAECIYCNKSVEDSAMLSAISLLLGANSDFTSPTNSLGKLNSGGNI
jgi:hypothetical protein